MSDRKPSYAAMRATLKLLADDGCVHSHDDIYGSFEVAALIDAEFSPVVEALREFLEVMDRFGNWDDGCFYYSQRSASELQRPIKQAREAIAALESK